MPGDLAKMATQRGRDRGSRSVRCAARAALPWRRRPVGVFRGGSGFQSPLKQTNTPLGSCCALHNPGAAGRGGFVVEDPGARCACLSLQFQGAAGPKVCTHPCTALVNSVNVKITRAGSVPWVTTSDEGFWDGAKAVSPSAHWFFFRKNYARAEKLQWHRSSLLRKCPGSKARPSGAIQLRHSWEHQGLGRERWSSESPRSSRGRWRLQRHRDGIHVPAPSSRGRKLSRQFHAG
ncbi:uncharacterized protein LOC115484799 isoform X6 [Serinus canaria]|uniref:uncharacterized protein LOC115484799 isoform X5 n=1 Tax=Serinus canaria TaxID=9135 RepID=UPI0011AE7964|nr:uncharacterized protein LOC115484799 isoform X5 [Serinus canaria]XP_050826466.1 uncharacterized protein LOC115484799 isoform X6 [Serinus canaria]